MYAIKCSVCNRNFATRFPAASMCKGCCGLTPYQQASFNFNGPDTKCKGQERTPPKAHWIAAPVNGRAAS